MLDHEEEAAQKQICLNAKREDEGGRQGGTGEECGGIIRALHIKSRIFSMFSDQKSVYLGFGKLSTPEAGKWFVNL